jgi:hypothetical protein
MWRRSAWTRAFSSSGVMPGSGLLSRLRSSAAFDSLQARQVNNGLFRCIYITLMGVANNRSTSSKAWLSGSLPYAAELSCLGLLAGNLPLASLGENTGISSSVFARSTVGRSVA